MNKIYQKMLKSIEQNGFNLQDDKVIISQDEIDLLITIIQLYDYYIIRMPYIQYEYNNCYLIVDGYSDDDILLIIR